MPVDARAAVALSGRESGWSARSRAATVEMSTRHSPDRGPRPGSMAALAGSFRCSLTRCAELERTYGRHLVPLLRSRTVARVRGRRAGARDDGWRDGRARPRCGMDRSTSRSGVDRSSGEIRADELRRSKRRRRVRRLRGRGIGLPRRRLACACRSASARCSTASPDPSAHAGRSRRSRSTSPLDDALFTTADGPGQ